MLGRLLMKVLKSRRKVAAKNLELCFPELSEQEHHQLLVQNFENTGMALFESGMAWWWPDWRVRRLAQFEGYEHLQAALSKGKGVLMLAGHFLHLEMAARVLGLTHPSSGFYRPHDNPVIEYFQCRGRLRSNRYLISKRDVKEVFQILADNDVCFYLPDQDYGRNRCEFVPFFAVKETATTTGTLLFAGNSDCETVPIITSRNSKGYKVEVLPALENFPSGDNKADVTRVNQWVEQAVNNAPEQYMWVHRRFKTRPDKDAPGFYK